MEKTGTNELEVLCAGWNPSPVLFRWGNMPEDAFYPLHSHEWGEFVYSFSGVITISVDDKRHLVLPRYGIWVPPGVMHQCRNRDEAQHCSVFIASGFCGGLSPKSCSIRISPLMRQMLEYLRDPPFSEASQEYCRFLRVFIDQLLFAPSAGSYLPTGNDPMLSRLLEMLEATPGDSRSVKDLAGFIGITERSLSRKCRKELGITLLEWRQRLRVIKSLEMLEEGATVESIALELGYSSSSAFIAMFKRVMGQTPAEFHPGLK